MQPDPEQIVNRRATDGILKQAKKVARRHSGGGSQFSNRNRILKIIFHETYRITYQKMRMMFRQFLAVQAADERYNFHKKSQAEKEITRPESLYFFFPELQSIPPHASDPFLSSVLPPPTASGPCNSFCPEKSI